MLDKEYPYIGRMLSGRYQLRHGLKGGRACRAYEAIDTRLDLGVVVKFSDPSVDSTSHLRRLQREGVALCCLRHERIVRLLDWDVDASGIEFLALERAAGCALRECLRDLRTINPSWAIKIAVQMLEALEAVHAAGLLHRDVKPGNIILTVHRSTLIDFDLAIPLPGLRADRTWQRITLPGTCVGTVSYLPPERLKSAEPGVREDIYSLGLVLYEMLVGRLPHDNSEWQSDALDSHRHLPPLRFPEPASLNVPLRLQDITLRALETSPEKRFASAAEMRQALLDLKP